jgi:hypothetical protein
MDQSFLLYLGFTLGCSWYALRVIARSWLDREMPDLSDARRRVLSWWFATVCVIGLWWFEGEYRMKRSPQAYAVQLLDRLVARYEAMDYPGAIRELGSVASDAESWHPDVGKRYDDDRDMGPR